MRSPAFNEVAKKNENKELALKLEGRAITVHFPCSMIHKKPLLVEYIDRKKKKKAQEDIESASLPIGCQSGEAVLFHVCTSGEKKSRLILKNQKIKTVCEELTVYAYERETLEDALHRDGRFLDTVFGNAHQLTQVDTGEISEFSNVVLQDMDDKCFKICLKPAKQRGKKNQLGSRDETGTANVGDQNPSQLPPTTETKNNKLVQNEREALLRSVREIPKSEMV